MSFGLTCPHCDRRLEADEENIGAVTECPKCLKDFTIERPRVPLAAEPAADFITLACPSCGGQLAITGDVERFACAHCGREHLVRRNGGVVSLSPLVERLQKVQTGVDRAASELAIARIKDEIVALDLEKHAIIEKQGPVMLLLAILGLFGVIMGYFAAMFLFESFLIAAIVTGIASVLVPFMIVASRGKPAEVVRVEKTIDSRKQELAEHLRQVSLRE